METKFESFGKIARFARDIVITEKIDGTNAQVMITEDGDVLAGSRNRWLTFSSDNYGFARWVEWYKEDLLKLGPGRHFGEWWGQGINRGYGLKEKRFSLFNTARWSASDVRPECCHVVPLLYRGPFAEWAVYESVDFLKKHGSQAADFPNPEGIIIFHTAGNHLYKMTLENDDKPKGVVNGGTESN